MKTWIDLVLDNGEIVRVELPKKFEDEVREDIDNAMRRRDWWAVRCCEGVSAEFMGMKLDRVNMARVVAML
jgi:hypothetical protein